MNAAVAAAAVVTTKIATKKIMTDIEVGENFFKKNPRIFNFKGNFPPKMLILKTICDFHVEEIANFFRLFDIFSRK